MITIRVTCASSSLDVLLPQATVRGTAAANTPDAHGGEHDPRHRYAVGRAALRRLRVQHGSRTDDGAGAAFADGGYRLARRMAPDLRWRGPRLGGRPRNDRRGARIAGL